MLSKIRKFRKLPLEEKKLFLEAYVTLGIMRASILTISFKRLTCSLDHSANKEEITTLNDKDMDIAVKVGRAITGAAAYTPWKSACLVQSLTAQKMLQKRGIPGLFYIGVAKDEEKMKAHSVSQCGEIIITGVDIHETFKVLTVFGWGKE